MGTIPFPPDYTNTVGDLAGIPLRPPEGGPALRTGWSPPGDLNRRLSRRPAVPQPDTPVWNESPLPSTPPRAAERLLPASRTAPRGRAPPPLYPRCPAGPSTPGAVVLAPLPAPRPTSPRTAAPGAPRARPGASPGGAGHKIFQGTCALGPARPSRCCPRPGTRPAAQDRRAAAPFSPSLPLPLSRQGWAGASSTRSCFPPTAAGRSPGGQKPSNLLSLSPAPPRLSPSPRWGRRGGKQGSQQSESDAWGYVNKGELLAPHTQRGIADRGVQEKWGGDGWGQPSPTPTASLLSPGLLPLGARRA